MESGFLFAVLSVVGPVAIGIALVVMGILSQRLGEVTRMPPYYRWYFVAAALAWIGAGLRMLALQLPSDAVAVSYSALEAVAVTIGAAAAWRYWSWLFGERS